MKLGSPGNLGFMPRRAARQTGNPSEKWACTIAVAKKSPWAVIAIGYSGRLSRFYLLDLTTDRLIPGQFVGGRAEVLTISDDGELFGYYCENFNRQPQAFVAIARPPFSTALGWWVSEPNSWADIKIKNGKIKVLRYTWPIGGRFSTGQDYVKEDCPFEVVEWKKLFASDRRGSVKAWDYHNNRELSFKAGVLHADSERLIEFSAESFEEIETPTWAGQWQVSPNDQARRQKFLEG